MLHCSVEGPGIIPNKEGRLEPLESGRNPLKRLLQGWKFRVMALLHDQGARSNLHQSLIGRVLHRTLAHCSAVNASG